MASSPLTARSGGATPIYPASPARSRSNSTGQIAPALIAAFAATSPPATASATAAPLPFHGLRTTKKVYEGKEEYRKHPYLQGGGATSEQWQQTSGTRETRFHLGFYRQPVVFPHPPTDAEAAFAIEKSDRKCRNLDVRQGTLVKYMGQSTGVCMNLSAPNRESGGRKHFEVHTNDVLGGPINPNPNSGFRAELLGRDGAPAGMQRETVKTSIQGWASLI